MILQIQNLKKIYGEKGNSVEALKNINISVERGEFIAVMGASGSGKSTLLNCIATIDSPTSGSIILNNNDITKMDAKKKAEFRRKKLGFVFQDFNLLDTLTVFENIALALTINKCKKRDIDRLVINIARKLNIIDIINKYPYEISGGQKQRCACARAMITQPELILADEPTGALDSNSSKNLLDSMQILNHDMNITILLVTHDIFAASYASRIFFLQDGNIYAELNNGTKRQDIFFRQLLEYQLKIWE